MKNKTENLPLVSIIVPVYNVEQYLIRCVNSLISQDYLNIEILLIDDGSTDKSGKICDDLVSKDNRIFVFHKKNGGLSDARNFGIKKSKGKYITFVDSDDWISHHLVSHLYDAIIKNESDFVSCKLSVVNSISDNKVEKCSGAIVNYSQQDYAKKFFKIGNNETIHYACGKLFKRELLDDNIFPVGLTSEDVLGIYKVLLKSKLITDIDCPYYFYYKNEKSITGSKVNEHDFDLIKIWDEVVRISNGQYKKWALVNRYRTDATLLYRLARDYKYEYIIKKYKNTVVLLLDSLKKNKTTLLMSEIPFSRKVAIRLMCFNYKLFCKLLTITRIVKND